MVIWQVILLGLLVLLYPLVLIWVEAMALFAVEAYIDIERRYDSYETILNEQQSQGILVLTEDELNLKFINKDAIHLLCHAD